MSLIDKRMLPGHCVACGESLPLSMVHESCADKRLRQENEMKPDDVIDRGLAELRAFVRDRLNSLQQSFERDIDLRAKQIQAAAEVAKTGDPILAEASHLLVKDIELDWGGRVWVDLRLGDLSVQLGDQEMKAGRYRVVVALLPLEKKP